MLNEFIGLFLGAFDYFIPVDAFAREEYRQVLIIVVTALSILSATLIVAECIKGVFGAFWRSYK